MASFAPLPAFFFLFALSLAFLLFSSSSSSSASASSALLRTPHQDHHHPLGLLSLFDSWNAKHGKHYSPSQSAEKLKRFHIFRENLIRIQSHNSKPSASFKLGLNRFADMTNAEFVESRRLGLKRRPLTTKPSSSSDQVKEIKYSLPDSVDWRSLGAVTSVKDQGMCGSCWAFSATGAIEGANAVATGNLVSVSEQELVTCDIGGGSEGCNGGLMDDAFSWVIANGGIASEETYPYESYFGNAGTCNTKLELEEKAVTIDGYADVEPYSEEALMEAVSKQPISVAIEASAWDFQLYEGGVYDGSCSSDPQDVNHGVLLVGYGSENGVDYWIVKNSWGESWGDGGFIKMIRNGSQSGICAIHSMSSYPIKNASDSALIADS